MYVAGLHLVPVHTYIRTWHGDEYECMAGNEMETALRIRQLMQSTIIIMPLVLSTGKDKEYRICWKGVCMNSPNLSQELQA